ncbi:MAG: alginate export family protein [Verrucomicrobia bacterium]|nr:alginate export family protein [Verrucomicrobiota bacterium]
MRHLVVAVMLLLVATQAAADSKGAGLLNDWLRKESEAMNAWDFGGEFRLRYEDYDGAVRAASSMTSVPAGTKPLTTPVNPNTDFIARGQANSSDELLLRQKVHAGYSPFSWLTVYGEMRNSTAEWDRRSPGPDDNKAALQQAYILLGDPTRFPLLAKIGRQELIYGDQRFIGNSDWGNPGRTFDAIKLRFTNEVFWVDAFAARVVVPYQGHFDENNSYDTFSGIYASSQKLVSWQETQFFILSRNAGPEAVSASAFDVPGTPSTARDLFTFGFRFKSLPGRLGGWDYSLEAAGQLGTIYNSTSKKRLDHQAYGVFAAAGYTWTNLWASPRLGVGYDVGSGDADSTDGESGSFDNLFGTNHAIYGMMDLLCERNAHIPRMSASLTPLKNLKLSADYRVYYLYDTHDALYPMSGSGRNGNGYGIHPTYDSFVGTELDLVASYNFKAWWNVQAGYGHFFVGDYIKQSVGSVAANGGAVDANFVYVQTTFSF